MNDPVLKVAVIGDASVEAVEFVRTMPDGTTTDERVTCRVEAVYRAIGYRSAPIGGIPYDHIRGSVPHHEGRIVDAHGRHLDGFYTTGWAKRGPVGLIRHTKSDAKETVDAIIDDVLVPHTVATAVTARQRREGSWPSEGSRSWNGKAGCALTPMSARSATASPAAPESRVKVVDREDQVGVARSAVVLDSVVLAGESRVTYVVAHPCVDVSDKACVEESPVDCIYEKDLPDEWQPYLTSSVEYFENAQSDAERPSALDSTLVGAIGRG